MRTQHLGDAMDFAKGGILKLVMSHLNRPVVIPMLTDADNWKRRHFILYAKMLGVPVRRILQKNETFHAHERRLYFQRAIQRLQPSTDVFLDPDTGFRREGGQGDKQVRRSDIAAFLDGNTERVLVIYCHRREGVDKLPLGFDGAVEGGCSAFAYAGSGCAMLFLSNHEKRLEHLRSGLCGSLTPVGETRLTRVFHAAQDNAS